MDSKESCTKVLMLPWLAHGHITPFLELAKILSTKNFHIYLCSTPIILASIHNRVTETQSLSIELVPLHLPSTSPQLPPHRHTTNGLPPHLIPALKRAFDSASPRFSEVVQTLSPDLVIYDFLQPWAATIASECKIPAVLYFIAGAALVSLGLHLHSRPGVELPFPEYQHILKGFPKAQAPEEEAPTNDGTDDKTRLLESLEKSCKMILFNTFREFEGKYLDYLSILTKKKGVPLGPLVQEIDEKNNDSEIMQWLDTKDELSTVFVSFGSESFPSKEERDEIAHGLELSGVNFIWIVRFPAPPGEGTIEVEEALPVGFLERIGQRGMIVEGWAPQAQILAHPSTGGFVSHCGWNSILESLKLGVPIVAVPVHHDQPINAKVVEAVGFGVEVKRDENKRLDRENIALVIKKVVVDEAGVDVRTKAKEFSEIIRKKGDEEIDGLVKELAQLSIEGK
ncbi:hypothetical protein RHSIM_Rhsim09G0144000 [Rhododendron simsii]|uniref:Glycosyltransferase n=1 Tax=Rhododendron simsii TaxID=118357 RepID=A0A834GIV7_RHOSS|nr:hypothetical protein RHSIM_Rhsim09G0144000 [Rhododendron simsii]